MSKTDLCEFCGHRRDHHHTGCVYCYAVPDRHGLYCDEPLCCCIAFMEPALTDEEIEAMAAA